MARGYQAIPAEGKKTTAGRRAPLGTPACGAWSSVRSVPSDQFLAGTDQGPEPFCEQGDVKRLLEALVDMGPVDSDL